MGKFKIYIRRGQTNYAEKRLLAELEPILERKMVTDPNFAATFRAVTTPEDLKKLHQIYCSENATIISETKNTPQPNPNMEPTNPENSAPASEHVSETKATTTNAVNDPLNEAPPLIRDYVLSGDAYEKKETTQQGDTSHQEQVTFNEPTNFNEAFDIPDLDEDQSKVSNNGQENQSSQQNNTQKQGTNNPNAGAPKPKNEPLNPYADDQSSKSKVKQTKRFAKYITAFVCMALEKGYVWWTTKDINDAKLIEYELKDEFDVQLMISIDERTKITAKEFFQSMCKDALVNAKISQDDQDELSDALADVLMEKGITPTPMQTLMMVGGQIVGKQVLSAIMSTSVTSSILAGLKERTRQDDDDEAELMNEAASHNPEKTDTTIKENSDIRKQNSDPETFEDAQIVN